MKGGEKLDSSNHNYISEIITNIKKPDLQTIELIKKDIRNFQKKWKQAELNTTELQELNDLKLEKLHLLQWNKTPLLSKIVFCHKGKKYRALHSYSLFLPKNDKKEYEKMIDAGNQQKIFKKTFKDNLVNPDGIEKKVLSDNAVLNKNKIATFTGHAGLKTTTYEKPFEETKQNSKIVCTDWKPHMMMRVDRSGVLKCYELESGIQNTKMIMKMDTVDKKREDLFNKRKKIYQMGKRLKEYKDWFKENYEYYLDWPKGFNGSRMERYRQEYKKTLEDFEQLTKKMKDAIEELEGLLSTETKPEAWLNTEKNTSLQKNYSDWLELKEYKKELKDCEKLNKKISKIIEKQEEYKKWFNRHKKPTKLEKQIDKEPFDGDDNRVTGSYEDWFSRNKAQPGEGENLKNTNNINNKTKLEK